MPICLDHPDWAKESADWPHAEHSRFVEAAGHRWHVQRLGRGPQLLLLHGTAASTHSFADLATHLSESFDVMMVDLPGHGFTRAGTIAFTSPGAVASSLSALLESEAFAPELIVGHSAGAVAGVELARTIGTTPALFVSINGAFRSFQGLAKFVAPVLAKMFYLNPLSTRLMARAAGDAGRVRVLVENTGSRRLPERNILLYARLLRYSGHLSGALSLMAGWDVEGIEGRFAELGIPSLMIVGWDDRAVPPRESREVSEAVRDSEFMGLSGCGHLVHEERPAAIADLIMAAALRAGVLPFDDARQESAL